MQTTSSLSSAPNTDFAVGFDNFHASMESIHRRLTEVGARPLFTTDARFLFDRFLAAIPEDQRQHYNCHCCRSFIDRFGGLVVLDAQGQSESAVWEDGFGDAFTLLKHLAESATVTGVFLSSEAVWGTPQSKGTNWTHLSLRNQSVKRSALYGSDLGPDMALRKEEFGMTRRALADFSLKTLNLAVQLLESDSLYRAEKVLGPVRWLRDLQASGASDGQVWLAVAGAPIGFAHIRSGVAGTLLEDLKDGLTIEAAAAKFKAKMHPLQYQRPTAAPKAGNLDAAEAVVAKLGIAGSLRRRFATLEDVRPMALWLKPAPKQGGGAVFGHLKARTPGAGPVRDLPQGTMTWEKFQRTVLGAAERIQFDVPHNLTLVTFTAPGDPAAPSIFQWKSGLGWYLWHGLQDAHSYGLKAGTRIDVTAVLPSPAAGRPNHAQRVVFALEGAQETREPSLCLFPELLKPELHPIRASIEALSRGGKMERTPEPVVSGVSVPCRVLVTSGGMTTPYNIDRMD